MEICRVIVAYLGRKVAVIDGVSWRRLVACRNGSNIALSIPDLAKGESRGAGVLVGRWLDAGFDAGGGRIR